jgi:arginyl-tRNA synthetase
MKRSEKGIAELSKALSTFQKSAPKIVKDKKGEIQMKSGGKYGYKYADLATIWDKIRLPLSENSLSVIQSPTSINGQPALTTMISHESGEWIEDTMQLKITQDTPQGQGSAITYARRYMLCALLGIVADDDTDAMEHRTLTGIQKKRLWDTAHAVVPELQKDQIGTVNFLTHVIGKHPSRILETEFDDAISAVEGYTKSVVNEV